MIVDANEKGISVVAVIMLWWAKLAPGGLDCGAEGANESELFWKLFEDRDFLFPASIFVAGL